MNSTVLPHLKKSLVISGATGLLGSRVLELLKEAYEIHALVRSMPAKLVEGVKYYKIDFSMDGLPNTLPNRIDAVFHLAQSSKAKEFPEYAKDIYHVNTHATALLLDYARVAGATHFVFTSTGGLYSSESGLITESTPIEPSRGALRFYFDTKLCSEVLVKGYSDVMNIIILRPFFIYGPGQKGSMLVSRMVRSVRDGTPIKVVGKDGTKLNPVYVDDVVSVLDKCIKIRGAKIINIAGPQIVSIREIATEIGKVLGVPPVIESNDGIADRFVADIGKMEKLLKKPLVNFSEGIKRTINKDENIDA